MNIKSKLLSHLIIVILCIVFVQCSSSSNNEEDQGAADTAQTEDEVQTEEEAQPEAVSNSGDTTEEVVDTTNNISLSIDSPASDIIIAKGQFVNFSATSSDEKKLSLTYNWDFNGGATNSTDEDPGQVTFNSEGPYNISLTVSDPYGNSATDQLKITVVDGAQPKISAHNEHSCSINGSGAVYCWGSNSYGALGDGTTDDSYTPVQVTGIDGESASAVSVNVGISHSCALLSTGEIQCWGSNTKGQLGDGTTTNSMIPVTVSTIDGVSNTASSLDVGEEYSCALLNTGALQCWGDNTAGQLGDGTTDSSLIPVTVSGIDGTSSSSISVSAGEYMTCAVLSTGATQCWGDSQGYGLGDTEKTNSSSIPVQVEGIDGTNAIAVSVATNYYHTCVVLNTGAIKCWGENYTGQLGDGTTDTSNTPVDVFEMDGSTNHAVMVSTNLLHTCALLSTGAAKCWGDNTYAELGDGTYDSATSPVHVVGFDGSNDQSINISSGYTHSCLQTTTGDLKCWGSNASGAIGADPSELSLSTTPLDISLP